MLSGSSVRWSFPHSHVNKASSCFLKSPSDSFLSHFVEDNVTRVWKRSFSWAGTSNEGDLDGCIFGESSALCTYLMSERQGCRLFHWTWCYGNVPAARTSAGQLPSLGGLLESDCPIHLGPSQSAGSLSCSDTMETRGRMHQRRSSVEGRSDLRPHLKSRPLSWEK